MKRRLSFIVIGISIIAFCGALVRYLLPSRLHTYDICFVRGASGITSNSHMIALIGPGDSLTYISGSGKITHSFAIDGIRMSKIVASKNNNSFYIFGDKSYRIEPDGSSLSGTGLAESVHLGDTLNDGQVCVYESGDSIAVCDFQTGKIYSREKLITQALPMTLSCSYGSSNKYIVGFDDGSYYCSTTKLMYKIFATNEAIVASCFATDNDDVVYFGSSRGKIVAVQVSDGKVLLQNQDSNRIITSICVNNSAEVIAVLHSNGRCRFYSKDALKSISSLDTKENAIVGISPIRSNDFAILLSSGSVLGCRVTQ